MRETLLHMPIFQPEKTLVESIEKPKQLDRTFVYSMHFSATAGNRNAKSQKEGINHGYKTTEYPDPLG
jgi:hypothetical protein